MKIILNVTRKSSERYTLIDEPMGCCGEPITSATHRYSIANGVDRGAGYQGYQSVDYFLKCEYISDNLKKHLKDVLISLGYKNYL